MSKFTVYPAIDLRFGKVVRLFQGKGDRQTVYGNNPKDIAQNWIDQGAEWLHVVNLNGAFGENTKETEVAIKKIISAAKDKVKIQLGGGIRTEEHIKVMLSLGVSRIVLGTAVIENPIFGKEVIERFGGKKIAFGFDACGNEIMSRGWRSPSGKSITTLAKTLVQAGAQTLIYTNILKDGMQNGIDVEGTKRLADQTKLSVIASGGTAALEDIARVQAAGLDGVIVGRALYEGNFTLREALNVR